ncbi:MAG: RNA polymerase sigma factor [Verrucomicrobiota bacterium]
MSEPRMDFTALVDRHYQGLYQFAYSLAHTEADASDLTQETFLRWAQKGGQLRDSAKVKSWLFTTLYRLFLNRRRHVTRFPHDELSGVALKLPSISSEAVRSLEASEVMSALREIDETFRAPLVLFYLEDHSYQEIATILEIPEGTVMSRLWRGKALLREKLKDRPVARPVSNIIPMQSPSRKEARS